MGTLTKAVRTTLATIALATLGLGSLALTGCDDTEGDTLKDIVLPSAPSTTDAGGASAAAVTPPPTPHVGAGVHAAYAFKTSAQLASSISACFGAGVTGVTADMIQAIDTTAGDAGVNDGFLSSKEFAAGDDVVASQALLFDGDPAVARTGVRNETVSLPLLAALQNVGNVVGGNCAAQLASVASVASDAGTDGGAGAEAAWLCSCATHDAAAAMLARCLPSLDPSTYAAVVDPLATECAADPAAAVASLVASTTFGVQ